MATDAHDVRIPTEHGHELVGCFSTPSRPRGAGFILAPGRGYHMRLPLFETMSRLLVEAGFHVLRFDWAYFTAGNNPSTDLVPEVGDLQAAVNYAKSITGNATWFVAGKSLGSRVVLAHARSMEPPLVGTALLTPPIHVPHEPGQLLMSKEDFGAIQTPLFIGFGRSDPSCHVDSIESLIGSRAAPPQIIVTEGDHGFEDTHGDSNRTQENLNAVSSALVDWSVDVLER